MPVTCWQISARGARLLLKQAIKWYGDVSFTGHLSVQGFAELGGPCITVEGDCTVPLSSELHVANCSALSVLGSSGGIRVGRDLHVNGRPEVHESRGTVGGGVHAGRSSAQCVESRT